MNSRFDTLDNLIAYSRRYAFEYLEDFDIELSFSVEGERVGHKFSGEQQRNLFLELKEALHNAVKHSEAGELSIRFDIGDKLILTIHDNGIGMSTEESPLGNGLKNMKSRIENMGGSLKIENSNGVSLIIEVPLSKISLKE